jgi:D-threo-aldose 1-dehydrogenase
MTIESATRSAFGRCGGSHASGQIRLRRIETIGKDHGVKLAEAASRFPLSHSAIVSVIPGGRKPREVRRNAAMLDAQIPSTLWRALKAEGLLRSDAPTLRWRQGDS